jgi:hypothetical protein
MTPTGGGSPRTGHVYVAVSGYGKRVVPAAIPFEFARADDDALVASATWGDSPQTRRIATDAPRDRSTADPVATVLDGPERREWWLDTGGVYSLPLPSGWTAIVTGEVSPAFYLVREPDRAIFVQTARTRPALENLAAPGQTVVARGDDEVADWIELSYVHEGRLWRQRHELLRAHALAMITGQSPADDFADVRETQQQLTRRAVFGGTI